MNDSSFLGLLHNVALLLALVLIYDIVIRPAPVIKFRFQDIVLGLLIGGIAVAIMLTPWVMMPGVVFDTRSVLLSISGLFFGPLPTIIAMAIAAALRLYQGGGGALTGVLVIFATGTMGILWGWRTKKPVEQTSWLDFYLFGVLSHLVMLALMLTLPWNTAMSVLSKISLPVLILYPVGTVLLCSLLVNRRKREQTALALKASEDHLRKSETLYRLLTENMKDVVWIIDCETMAYRYVSPSVMRLLSFTPDEVLRQSISHNFGDKEASVLETNISERMRRYLSGAQEADLFYNDQVRQIRKDGSLIWTEVTTRFYTNPENKHVEIHGVSRDIDERKRTEEALHVKSQALEASLNAVAFANLDGALTYVNPAFLQMWGCTDQDQVLGISALKFWQIEDKAGEVMAALRQKGCWVGELVASRKDGTAFIAEVSASMVLDLDGKPINMQAAFVDVTAQKQAEEENRQSQRRLREMLAEAERSRVALLSVVEDQREAEEQVRRLNRELEVRVKDRTAQLTAANQELEAFSYSVSHDLRAPLRALDGYSSILVEDYAKYLDDQGLHYLNRIRDASQRMGQLINDLLDLSRITRFEFVRQPVDLSAMTQTIAAELKAQAHSRQIAFIINPNMTVNGDANLLKIVMENLLGNAVKFTGKCERAVIQVGMLEKDNERIIFVRDNGAGFNMEYASKLFVPFQRLHGPQDYPGSGIGLSIVQRIITRHGGQIWPESNEGQGTTFFFTLEPTPPLAS